MKKLDLNKVKETLKLTDFPVQLTTELIANCNLRCPACPYPHLKREKGIMSDALYKKIVDEITQKSPKNTTLWLAFMGEPTILGKKLFEMIKYAKDKGIKDTSLNTNANLINQEMIDWILESGLDKIYVSIDAATEDSYKKIRTGGDFKKTRDVVSALIARREEKKVAKPEVFAQFISMEENAGEEEPFRDYWVRMGAVTKLRRKMGWGGKINSKDLDISQSNRNMPCPWLVRQMIVLWDGRVAQCDADYEGIYAAGDLNKQSIAEVWNGELKIRRDRHQTGDFDFLPCNQCRDWQLGLSEFYYPKK